MESRAVGIALVLIEGRAVAVAMVLIKAWQAVKGGWRLGETQLLLMAIEMYKDTECRHTCLGRPADCEGKGLFGRSAPINQEMGMQTASEMMEMSEGIICRQSETCRERNCTQLLVYAKVTRCFV